MKPTRIIILSTPSALESEFLRRLESLPSHDIIMMLEQAPPSGICPLSLTVKEGSRAVHQELLKWHEDMTFCAKEEKSLQPTNPYFGKEKWKKNRKR